MHGCIDELYKENVGVGSVTLMTRVTGFEELQSEMSDRDPCSSFVTESAWPTWGVPLLLTYPSVCLFEPFDRLKKPDGLSRRRSHFGSFHVPPGEAKICLRVVRLWFSRTVMQ